MATRALSSHYRPIPAGSHWLISAALGLLCLVVRGAEEDPLSTVRRVADRVMSDTRFELTLEPSRAYPALQRIDFRHELGSRTAAPSAAGAAYAISEIVSAEPRTLQMGVSSTGPIKIWINGVLVYNRETPSAVEADSAREIEGDLYQLKDAFPLSLAAGTNRILVREIASASNDWQFFLAPVPAERGRTEEVSFSAKGLAGGLPADTEWLVIGPFSGKGVSAAQLLSSAEKLEKEFAPSYENEDRFFVWQAPAQPLVQTAVIPTTAAFRAHSYAAWHYANSTMLFGFPGLATASGESKYADFARRYCDFTLDHEKLFGWQFHELHVYRGFDAEFFRPVKLDYTTGPGLVFAALVADGNYPRGGPLVERLANYLAHGQPRLPDGTICRLEPIARSVWADDLFMSVPFLLRVQKLTGDRACFDDVAKQVLQFTDHLFDERLELFYHGWFSPTAEHSIAHWSRANGWVAWAMAEALDALPPEHPAYAKILTIYRRHMSGLARVQAEDGLWHQILDRPNAWEETSSSSMFVLAMARGVRRGWLDLSYADCARRGWKAIAAKVDANGCVHDICQSTPMGFSEEFYLKLERRLNDPRGLGAFITAGVEMAKLEQTSWKATTAR